MEDIPVAEGSVRLQESDDFSVVVNITASTYPDAFSVETQLLRYQDSLVLQVFQKTVADRISLTWLFIGISAATGLVLLCATIYALCWFNSEQSMYDLAERKSYSSQHGTYRSRNSMQMALQQGDIALLAEVADNMHNDDTLKRVPEMPEEEDAEAIEMEELKGKEKGEDFTDKSDEATVNISEKNLARSRFHAQNKTIHKELIKKGKRKRFHRAKPPSETYDTVMEYPENSSEGSGVSDQDGEEKDDGTKTRHEGPEHHVLSTFHPKVSRLAMPDGQSSKTADSNQMKSSSGPRATSPYGQDSRDGAGGVSDPGDNTDPLESPLLVQADVHQVRPGSDVLRNPQDRKNPGNPGHGGVRATVAASSAKAPQRKVAFSDDERNDPKSCTDALDIFQEVSKRYDLGQRLGVIRESVTEDTSDFDGAEGENRCSIYGSSEIFDTADIADRVYFDINDSDLEIPPIDSDDSSLPSTSQAGYNQQSGAYNSQAGYNSNNPHSGYNPHPPQQGYNPHPQYGHQSPHLQNQTGESLRMNPPNPAGFTTFGVGSQLAHDLDTQRHSTDSGCVSSSQTLSQSPVSGKRENPSPPLPPPPEESQQTLGEPEQTSFDFPPPPPKLLKIPEQGLWKQQSPIKGDNYNYVDFHKADASTDPKDELKKTQMKGRGKTYQGPRYLHLSLLSVVSILGILGGVYSQTLVQQPLVQITVNIPRSFLKHQATVYFNHETDGDVYYERPTKVQRFDIPRPILMDLTLQLCVNHTCEQGCDKNTGQCVCMKGFKMSAAGTCQDINECMEGGAKCHPTAGCLNSLGLYECICPGGFYGDGKTCKECRIPCNPGTYEVQPCTNTTHKICRDCTKMCPDGYFMLRPCTISSNSHCRACQKMCGAEEYEYQTCQRDTNRICKGWNTLPLPEPSHNVILENLYSITDQTQVDRYLPSKQSGTFTFTLHRGSGLKIQGTMKSVQAAQLFIPINSSGNGSFNAIPQSGTQSQILRQFCPSPVPNHYILHYDKIMNITFSLDSESEPAACQSYQMVGRFPGSTTSSPTHFVTSEPSPLTDLFDGIKSEFFRTSTIWVEKSKRCQHYSKRCEDCTRQCARHMSQSSSECSVLGSESDNGYSPRLRVCYNCCARHNCSDVCKDYHKRHCQPKKCYESNWMEFFIRPQWDSSKINSFYCHIQPLPRQHILELEFSLQYRNQSFYKGKVSLKGDKHWEKTGKMTHKGKILTLEIDSKLGTPPDFLEGEIVNGRGMFKVGKYRDRGPSVLSSIISGESVSIRPRKPFGAINKTLSSRDYVRAVLENSVLAAEVEAPYEYQSNLMVVTFLKDTYPYHITPKNDAPQLLVNLPKVVSILASVFDPVQLIHKSIQGEMMNNNTHWVISISGRVKQCPGVVKAELYDPGYPTTPIYKYWVAVNCPCQFNLNFVLPTSDAWDVEKELVVMITDERKTHQIRIHSPGQYRQKNRDVVQQTQGRKPPMAEVFQGETTPERPYGVVFSIPYLAPVFGAVILLILLAIIGLIVAPDSIGPETPSLRWHHMLMMISYVTINFLYSIIVTMTVFSIIVVVVNKESCDFLAEYKQQSYAHTAIHHIELAAMRHHLVDEIDRQNEFAMSTKARCEQSMKPVIADMDKLRHDLLEQTKELFEQQNIVTLLSEHSHEVLTRLAQNMLTFRNNYDRFVRDLLAQILHDIKTSLNSIEQNKWLAGARFLHGAVLNIRKHLNNVSSKQFLDWAHLNLDELNRDMQRPPQLPDIPHIHGKSMPTEPPPTPPPTARTARNLNPTDGKARRIKIHSHWFYPFGSSGNKEGNQTTSKLQEQSSKVTPKSFVSMLPVFLGLMLCVDILLFLHRFSKTVSMGRLLLYGFPEYIDCREKHAASTDEELEDDVFHEDNKTSGSSQKNMLARLTLGLKKFFIQVVSSLFIPKAVVTVVLCLIIYTTVIISNIVFTPKVVKSLDLYFDMTAYLNAQADLMNTRILSHAEQINTVEYPSYQSWMVAHIERHQRILEVHRQELAAMRTVHNQTYCQYLTHLGMNVNCTTASSENPNTYRISTPGCRFAPVWPNLYSRSRSSHLDVAEKQLAAILNTMRKVVINTCQIVVVFMTVVLLKELFGAVLWIFIRRSGFVRLRIIFETTEEQTLREG